MNIGIVGVGGMGTVHYQNYLHLEDCTVTGVVTYTPKDEQQAEKWGVTGYHSIEELVEHADVQVIDICTPTFMHKEHVCQALQAGAHVIVEKPCALSQADVHAMYDCARRCGKHLYVAQVLQFSREIEVLRRLVEEQTYGKPLDGFFRRLSARPAWVQGGWLFDREKSGLVPFDLHIHDLDIIASLFGTPEPVYCAAAQGSESSFPELYRWEYRCGAVNVAAEAGWLNAGIPFTATWRVYFERAAVIYDGQTVTAYPYGAEPIVYDTEDSVKIPTGINIPPTGWYWRELGHFLDCIRRNEPSPLVPEARISTVIGLLEQTAT